MTGGPHYDGAGYPIRAREPVSEDSPRDILEESEQIPEATQAELAHALGRIIVWLLDGQKLTRIGERVIVLAYKLRPDLIGGGTLADIAKRRDLRRSWVNKLQRQFTRTFGVRGLNAHARPIAGALVRTVSSAKGHGVAESHLKLVNRFTEWRAFHDEAQGAVPRDAAQRDAMRRDFAPIAQFLEELDA